MTIGSVIAASTSSRPGKASLARANAIATPATDAKIVAQAATLSVSSRGTRTSWETGMGPGVRRIRRFITLEPIPGLGQRQENQRPVRRPAGAQKKQPLARLLHLLDREVGRHARGASTPAIRLRYI